MRLNKYNLNQEKKKSSLKSVLWSKTMGEFIQKQLKKVALPEPESEKNNATFFPDMSFFFKYVLIAGVGLPAQTGCPTITRS